MHMHMRVHAYVIYMHVWQARLAVGVDKQGSFFMPEDGFTLLTNIRHTQSLLLM